MENKRITIEEIKKAADYVFNQPRELPEGHRRLIMTRYCKTYGTIKYDSAEPDLKLCQDSECTNCMQMRQAFKEEFENYVK